MQTTGLAQIGIDDGALHGERVQHQFDIVTRLAGDLAGRFELMPLLERILGHATTLLGCDSGSMSLVDEVRGTYTKKVDFGVGCQEGQTFSLKEGITGEVVRSRGTVILDDYSQVTSGHISPHDPRWNCAVIGVPIRWGQEIIGAFAIFSAAPGRVFTPVEASLVELFAGHAAIALANSDLHAKATERDREAAVAAERERAVRDVHETVGRSLAALLGDLDDADRSIASGASDDAAMHVSSARTIAHDALTETRRTALGLGPASLAGRTLEQAIQAELQWVEAMSGATTQFTIIGTPREVTPEISHQTFRILQEALGNVVSHARARVVRVGLIYDASSVSLLVEDNGRGFDVDAAHGDHSSLPSGCLGLHGMTSRALHVRGELVIDSIPGWGTKVRVSIPDAAAVHHAISRPSWKVLIANDQPLIRAGFVRLLNLHEPAIQIAAEVTVIDQLLDAYEMLRPDVVLIDLDMVHRDLAGVLTRVRELDPDVAIVVITDNPTVDQIRSAKQAGVRGYINRKSDGDTIARIIVAAGQGQALMEGDMFDHLTETTVHQLVADNLTTREREVREMVAKGMADKQIGAALNISAKTVEKHVGSLLRKTGARNRTMLVSMNSDQQSSPALASL
ncbi:MAG: LuxR C-terminal-related transcriptional regulator [Naasia sp.]